MNRVRHLIVSLILAFLILIIGTFGYMLIEGWNFMDSLYMTVITISTVGYGEVRQVDLVGRVFTIFIVLTGVGFSVYVAGAVVQLMVEGQIRQIMGRRRLDQKIKRLKNHYIICGYGRIGRVLVRNLRRKISDIVVIDNNPDLAAALEEDGVLYVAGDATEETTLIKAGIQKARGLVSALATDTNNVFLVLTARQLNPHLDIIARAGEDRSKDKLKAAGATTVESPYEVGALRLAQKILRPKVTSFLDFALSTKRKDILMEELPVSGASRLASLTLKDSGIRQRYNLIVIAIEKATGEMLFNPSFESLIAAGDTLIAVGEEPNLHSLAKTLNPNK
ncbi:MAG: potassium channel protein [Desulfosarcina sp.]|nr:potassium channel protein [Desulfobacterales bacterium]